MVRIRRRGTAIVETSEGILVVAERNGLYLLPGGGAKKGESRTHAAIRELREETGLIAVKTKFLFRYIGRAHKSQSGEYFTDHHTIVLIHAIGVPTPKREIKYIGYYHLHSNINISRTTREIIDRYHNGK